jgi:hypothetical protein
MMCEKHNVSNINVATINLQLYNVSTKSSVVALALMSDHLTEQGSQLKENYSAVKFNSSRSVFQ